MPATPASLSRRDCGPEAGKDGILLLEAEKETPYERPPLSKELLKAGAPEESTVLRKEKFYQDKRIDRLAGLTVGSIDRPGRNGTPVRRQPLTATTGSSSPPVRGPGP